MAKKDLKDNKEPDKKETELEPFDGIDEFISEAPGNEDIRDVVAVENRERYEKQLARTNNPWNLTPRAIEAKKAAMTMLSTKNGMHARIPLICKGDTCPYAEACQLLPYDLAPQGEYCPIELAQIDVRTAGYANDIGFDKSSFTDRNLLSEIVSLDIMLERCKALMAKEGTPVIDVAIGVSDKGDEIKQPTVSKSWEAYEKISKKRDSVYQLMMMTRRDNKDKEEDTSSSLSDILAKVSIDGSVVESK